MCELPKFQKPAKVCGRSLSNTLKCSTCWNDSLIQRFDGDFFCHRKIQDQMLTAQSDAEASHADGSLSAAQTENQNISENCKAIFLVP